jgi:hypothetical protein
MSERYTELSAYLRRKSREPSRGNPPDLSEDEGLLLAITISLAVSLSLVVSFATVLLILAKSQ